MALTLNGTTNTISGLAVGGLPDGVVDEDTLADGSVTDRKRGSGDIKSRSGRFKGSNDNDSVNFTDSTALDITINSNIEFKFEADGDFHADGDVIAFSTSVASDERLKENIEIIPNSLEKLEEIKGVSFNWKRDGKKSAGVIAQDVLKVLPEAVKEVKGLKDDNTHLSVNYQALTSILIEAVKELSEKIKVLEAK